MKSIVINRCYGGFDISRAAVEELRNRGCASPDRNIPRDDPLLIALMREWGPDRVSHPWARLAVVEIPDDVEWQIEEYDGLELVIDKHRVWPQG